MIEENKKLEKKENKKNNEETSFFISKEKLLEYGVHFGHKKNSWNPKMKPFIHGQKNKTHIINLNKIITTLRISYTYVEQIAKKGGTFLFVGTSKQAKNTIKENAERVGAFYISERWLGGTLTNFKTIQNSIKRLRYLERLQKSNFDGYTKKEASKLSKELQKLELNLGGIKYMRRLPNAIFVSSVVSEKIVVNEAKKFNIPIFGIVDTDGDPRSIQFPIVGNDDGNKSVSIITTIIADAIASAKGSKKLVVGVDDKEDIRVLGLQKQTSIYKNEGRRFYNKKNNSNFRRDFNNNRGENKNFSQNNRNNFKRNIDDNNKKTNVNNQEIKNDKIKLENSDSLKENKNINFSNLKVFELKKLLEEKNIKFDKTLKKDGLIELANKNLN